MSREQGKEPSLEAYPSGSLSLGRRFPHRTIFGSRSVTPSSMPPRSGPDCQIRRLRVSKRVSNNQRCEGGNNISDETGCVMLIGDGQAAGAVNRVDTAPYSWSDAKHSEGRRGRRPTGVRIRAMLRPQAGLARQSAMRRRSYALTPSAVGVEKHRKA